MISDLADDFVDDFDLLVNGDKIGGYFCIYFFNLYIFILLGLNIKYSAFFLFSFIIANNIKYILQLVIINNKI